MLLKHFLNIILLCQWSQESSEVSGRACMIMYLSAVIGCRMVIQYHLQTASLLLVFYRAYCLTFKLIMQIVVAYTKLSDSLLYA